MRRRPLDPAPQIYSHSRTRTTSSNIFPIHHSNPMHLQQPQPMTGHTRRSPSVNTFSTTSSAPPPASFRTSPTSDIRRSTSSRSGGGQPTSYVALLRKQKATVWCDRSQTEDPQRAARQRAAKQRAAQEVVGRPAQARTSTGIGSAGKVAAKIRHHGKPGVVGYAPDNNYIGVGGVPLRLSATEVEGEDSDDDDVSMQRLHHRRTGSSGRSSTASGRRGVAYRNSSGLTQGGKKWSPSDTPERGSMVMEDPEFLPGDDKLSRAQSTASGSSGERADALPELVKPSAAKLASNSLLNAALTREKSVKNPEELRRRGSVDERTMTLNTSGRLFIANPDL
ncbi:Uu.00g087870.m01.CDS01 [Anthostomella pinea]|uniref:Uu.00g087870.m01.CDS01 n=1 Tax=Anthostomella pinea TaxID=933095 RepID=A0AAI8VNC7_9PEZI|nr:Uu.00g087870.m01.CDS01 [Anthostomella pinea]